MPHPIYVQIALACSLMPAVAPAWAQCSPQEDFKPFSERFIADKEFRRQRTAEVVVIQYGQEDLVPNPKTERLNKRDALERRKLAIRTPEERRRDQLLESRSCAGGICLIQQYADGSDIENVYYFRRRGGCWTLTRITNAM